MKVKYPVGRTCCVPRFVIEALFSAVSHSISYVMKYSYRPYADRTMLMLQPYFKIPKHCIALIAVLVIALAIGASAIQCNTISFYYSRRQTAAKVTYKSTIVCPDNCHAGQYCD